jgi:phage terminase large subunit GpA-like protein
MQATCSLLQGYKFVEPLATRRAEHEKSRKALKERWQKERKRIQEAVALLLKAKAAYMQRTQEYERCRDALRIAEQVPILSNRFSSSLAVGENKLERLALIVFK